MTNKIKLITASVVFCAIAGNPALANSMRCGTHLITGGDTGSPGKYEILKRCGEPKARYGNTWVYEKGSSKRVVHFNSAGAVTRIE